MAAGWITQINNFSDSDFTVRTNDGTWRPVIGGRQYGIDEPISVPRRRTAPMTIPSLPWLPPIPPGPTTLDVQYAMIGWVDFARTRIQGPAGIVDVLIGPAPPTGNDYLRFFDDQQAELGNVELGPRGSGAIASVDFHLNIYPPTRAAGQPDTFPEGVHLLWWNQNGVGANILARLDATIGAIAQIVAGGLIGVVTEKVFGDE